MTQRRHHIASESGFGLSHDYGPRCGVCGREVTLRDGVMVHVEGDDWGDHLPEVPARGIGSPLPRAAKMARSAVTDFKAGDKVMFRRDEIGARASADGEVVSADDGVLTIRSVTNRGTTYQVDDEDLAQGRWTVYHASLRADAVSTPEYLCEDCGEGLSRQEAFLRGGVSGPGFSDWAKRAWCRSCAGKRGWLPPEPQTERRAASTHTGALHVEVTAEGDRYRWTVFTDAYRKRPGVHPIATGTADSEEEARVNGEAYAGLSGDLAMAAALERDLVALEFEAAYFDAPQRDRREQGPSYEHQGESGRQADEAYQRRVRERQQQRSEDADRSEQRLPGFGSPATARQAAWTHEDARHAYEHGYHVGDRVRSGEQVSPEEMGSTNFPYDWRSGYEEGAVSDDLLAGTGHGEPPPPWAEVLLPGSRVPHAAAFFPEHIDTPDDRDNQEADEFAEARRPVTTRPRQMPQSTTPEVPMPRGNHSKVKPDGSAEFRDISKGRGVEFSMPSFDRQQQADFSKPSADQQRQARIARITARVHGTNPHLTKDEARRIATEAVNRYPEMVTR